MIGLGERSLLNATINLSTNIQDIVKAIKFEELNDAVMPHAGDLHGRKKMFTLSVFLMALPTLGIGLLPTYGSLSAWAPVLLLLLRILQGAAVGGEVLGAWVFVAEHVPPSRVGLACGVLTAGLTGGILLGSLLATGLNMLMPPEQVTAYGWRIPFLLGGAFGLMSMYLRYLLTETPVFEELRKRRALSAETPLRAVVRDHRAAIVLSGLHLDAVRCHCRDHLNDSRFAPKGVQRRDCCDASG
jgi:MFS family permease